MADRAAYSHLEPASGAHPTLLRRLQDLEQTQHKAAGGAHCETAVAPGSITDWLLDLNIGAPQPIVEFVDVVELDRYNDASGRNG